MKRLLFAIIALLCITSCEMYEDDNSYYINAQEAARVVMEASNSGSYITDIAKMADFKVLTMEEFLSTYDYITEDEYEATRLYLNWLNADDSKP